METALVCGTRSRAKTIHTVLLAHGRAIVQQEDTGALENSGSSEKFANLAFAELVELILPLASRAHGEGVLVCADLCSRRDRKSLCGLLHKALPDISITCTFVLSPTTQGYPSEPELLHKGLPKTTPNLVVPALAFEEHLAGACVVLADNA